MRGGRLFGLVFGVVVFVFGAGIGCGADAKLAGMDAGAGGNDGPRADLAAAADSRVDSTGFEPVPLPYFFGTCGSGGGSGLVPTDWGPLPFGLTVVAAGLPMTVGLEVDGTNAYLVTSSALLRLPLSGGTPAMMVSGVAPVATAIDADNIYWIDSGVAGQTTILRAPLTATGWAAFAGDGGGSQAATMLASQAGTPGPFTVGGGFVYFAIGNVVSRVPAGGGTVQTVSTTFTPRGLAAASDALYLTEFSGETIQRVSLTGTLPATPTFLKLAYAVPTAVVLNGGELYWNDWFGGYEYLPIATPTDGRRFPTSCGGPFSGPCENRLRPAGRGVVWASDPDECGTIGRVNPDGAETIAGALASIGGVAGTSTHAYVTTSLGELLRLAP